jgi:hypothetical protein
MSCTAEGESGHGGELTMALSLQRLAFVHGSLCALSVHPPPSAHKTQACIWAW